MKIEKSAIYLAEEDMLELQGILFDEDEKAALEFLKRLRGKIEIQQRRHCGTGIVKGE
jgi:hypothetical protein